MVCQTLVATERSLTSRRRRPGMLRVLLLKLYNGGAGIAGDGSNPGASARVKYNVIRQGD